MDFIPKDDLEEALTQMRINSMTQDEYKEYSMSDQEKITRACKEVICKKCKSKFLVSFSYNGKYPLCKKHRLLNVN